MGGRIAKSKVYTNGYENVTNCLRTRSVTRRGEARLNYLPAAVNVAPPSSVSCEDGLCEGAPGVSYDGELTAPARLWG